jgi:dihydrofolate reductase
VTAAHPPASEQNFTDLASLPSAAGLRSNGSFSGFIDTPRREKSILEQADWHNSRIAAADPAATVRQPRKEQGGGIRDNGAGASMIRNLLEAGELDRLSITLCPELVGGGGRLFDDGPAGSSWSLTSVTGTESGGICLFYDRIRPA